MSNRRPILPETVRFYRAEVSRVAELRPGFRRVTVSSEELSAFDHLGFDHWFRLFLPHPDQTEWRLPTATSKLWYAQWLATPARQRPHCANYTVADFRPTERELDIDVVLHRRPSGELEGRVAQWAASADLGDRVALLDEGLLFNPPSDTSAVVLAGDESALRRWPAFCSTWSRVRRATPCSRYPLVPTFGSCPILPGWMCSGWSGTSAIQRRPLVQRHWRH